MDADLDTLATALYVTTDDLLRAHPERVPMRPKVGFKPQISDAELLTLAVMQALLGFTSEDRFLRYARRHLLGMFPTLPRQSGYNKRLRKLADTMTWLISALAAQTSIGDDDVWIVDSTPVECGRSRETQQRSDLAGWAEYGYCASHSRFFWGLRLHLVCTLHGLPVGWALTGAKADEREVLRGILEATPALAATAGRRRIMLADKNYYGHAFETDLDQSGIDLIRPARKGEQPRPGQRFLKPLRQIIESVNDTFKGQLDLERHGGKTPTGVCARIAQRVLALTAAIWHNDRLGLSVRRSLIAYDH
ncbi:MAG TPA: IS982 family transposase [Actinomycetes bacterium]|nr:IS982 family transposase [Actinomycetes bacterium]